MVNQTGRRQRLLDPIVGVTGGPAGYGMTWYRVRYDFAVQGGAVGVINLSDVGAIPANFVCMFGMLDVRTPLTSGGAATVALALEAAADLLAATAFNAAGLGAGRRPLIPAWTPATSIRTTVPRTLQMTVAVAALTAGQIDVYLLGFFAA